MQPWQTFIQWSNGHKDSMTLMIGGLVAFRDGPAHGYWREDAGDIIIGFHYLGIEAKVKEHRYRRLEHAVAFEHVSVDGWRTNPGYSGLLLPKQ